MGPPHRWLAGPLSPRAPCYMSPFLVFGSKIFQNHQSLQGSGTPGFSMLRGSLPLGQPQGQCRPARVTQKVCTASPGVPGDRGGVRRATRACQAYSSCLPQRVGVKRDIHHTAGWLLNLIRKLKGKFLLRSPPSLASLQKPCQTFKVKLVSLVLDSPALRTRAL